LGQRRATTARARAPEEARQPTATKARQGDPPAAAPGAVLELQRLAGNRAVAGLTVQRFGLGDAFEAVAKAGGTVASVLALGASLLVADDREATLLDGLVRHGFTDRTDLTNVIWWLRHPDRIGSRIERGEQAMAAEWLAIRRTKVDAALARATAEPDKQPSGPSDGPPPTPATRPTAKPMSETERARLVEAAKEQGSGGSEALTAQMEAALPKGMKLDEWFAGHVPDATFLGLRIRASGGTSPGVHENFLAQLQKAEAALRAKFPGQDDDAIRAQLGVTDIAGLRPPKLATGGSMPSMHCFGMAVDINPATNPFVGNKKVKKSVKDPAARAAIAANRAPRVIERAMLLVHGEQFDAESKLDADNVEQAYDLHARASGALADYLKLVDAGDAELLPMVERAQATGDPHDLAWWRERIAKDKQVLPLGDLYRHHDPSQKGYMDLAKELVLALTQEGGLLWGGTYRTAKDMMHFDYRGGPIDRDRK
jgi:D-alanyl-D-alanine carboxypeptidase